MSRKELLQYAFERGSDPSASNFKKVCDEWMISRFPEVDDDKRLKALKTFIQASRKKWKEADSCRATFLEEETSQDWLSSEFKRKDFYDIPPPYSKVKKEKAAAADDSQPCPTCGHHDTTLERSSRRQPKRQKRQFIFDEEPQFPEFQGNPEDNVAEMLKTHASDDAAFVFEELMQNPMEVGREVAAYLRRKQANGGKMDNLAPSLTVQQPSNVYIAPLAVTNRSVDFQNHSSI